MITTNGPATAADFRYAVSKIEDALSFAKQLAKVAPASNDLQFDRDILELRRRCADLLHEATQLVQPPSIFGG